MSNSKNTEKSDLESVGKQNDVASYPLPPPVEPLKKGESRTSYLTRQGFGAILEYEKKEVRGRVKMSSQERDVVVQQLERLEHDTNYHIEKVMAYLTQNKADTNGETNISVKEVDNSITWLEKVDPDAGQLLRQELFCKHKARYDFDKLEEENTKSLDQVKRESHGTQEQCLVETPPSSHVARGSGFSKYFLSALLFFYFVNQIYKKFYKSKSKRKD